MNETIGLFQPLAVGGRSLSDQQEAVEATAARVLAMIDDAQAEVARYIVQWHIASYNEQAPSDSYHVWIQQSPMNAVIWPWLGERDGGFLKKWAAILFAVKPGYGSDWTMPWNAPRLAKLMTEVYRELGSANDAHPELAEIRAFTLQSHPSANIFLKLGDEESVMEISDKVGGYFD